MRETLLETKWVNCELRLSVETSCDEVTRQRDRRELLFAKNLRESIQAFMACQPKNTLQT
jgi:hypothetical protein